MDRILLAIGIVLIVLGVKMIYDARPIVKAYFSFGDENEATLRDENFRIFTLYYWWCIIIF